MALSSPSPSKKLLITDPKPIPAPISASSSSATSTPPEIPGKRTRDQPNLSDCHCCGRRIIHSNPKDRLQPLDSVWRIILLCRKCRRSVCSGQTCPYCFQITGNTGDFCTCEVCQRRIHKDCVMNYGKCTPWCYLGIGFEGFKVCVDCWVPELLKNSVCGLKDKCEGNDLLENDVLQNGKCEVIKKVKKVKVKVKEQASRRAKGTIDEVDLVNGASNLFPKKDRDSLKAGNSSCSGETEAVDDAELAIQLHRVINSSPRILRGKSLGNLNDLDSPNIRIWKGLSYKRSGLGKRSREDQKLEVCTKSAEIGPVTDTLEKDSSIGFSRLSQGLISYERGRKTKYWQLDDENTDISEPTSSQQAERKPFLSDEVGSDTSEDSCIDGGRYRQELISYKRTKFKNKASQLNGLVGDTGDSSSCGNHGVAFKPECCQSGHANLISLVNSDANEILISGSRDREHDRFRLKYVKRIRGTKTCSNFLRDDTLLNEIQVSTPVISCSDGYSANDCELILPNGACAPTTDRFSFKYSKRVKSLNPQSNWEAKLHSLASMAKIDKSPTGLTTNWSAKSRSLTDVSPSPL